MCGPQFWQRSEATTHCSPHGCHLLRFYQETCPASLQRHAGRGGELREHTEELPGCHLDLKYPQSIRGVSRARLRVLWPLCIRGSRLWCTRQMHQGTQSYSAPSRVLKRATEVSSNSETGGCLKPAVRRKSGKTNTPSGQRDPQGRSPGCWNFHLSAWQAPLHGSKGWLCSHVPGVACC